LLTLPRTVWIYYQITGEISTPSLVGSRLKGIFNNHRRKFLSSNSSDNDQSSLFSKINITIVPTSMNEDENFNDGIRN